jgi:competence protein ComEC
VHVPTRSRALGERAVVVLAAAVWLACAHPVAVPPATGLVLVAAALLLRRPWLLVVGAAILASGLAARAEAGLVPPEPQAVRAEVTLLTDPVDRIGGTVRAEVRLGRRRVEAWASGAAAAALRPRLAGERLVVEGRLRPPSPVVRDLLARRHVGARLDVRDAGPWRPGSLPSRVANGLRRTLAGGAEPLGDERRTLFTGMVLGDDRGQPVEVADDFKAAGLTHLLAVSGQNVAFVLVLCRPLLRRLRLGPRWAATLAVLAFFALLTRFEPSVLRATAMAAVVCTADTVGRPASRVRVLALAVTGLLLVDPFLAGALGFQLSVGATLGIALLARPLAERLPGPRPVAEALAVCAAAQVGVAPVLVPAFGGLPVAALPANLLAVPAAGPVLAWGLTAGLVAGVLGPPLDGLLHLPTAALLAWVAGVARVAARLPLGTLTAAHLAVLGALGLLALAAATVVRRRSRALVPAALAACVAVLLTPAVAPPAGAVDGAEVATGVRLWRRDAVVLLVDRGDPGRILDQLRNRGVRRVDVLVSIGGSRNAAGVVAVLRSRLPVRVVLAPVGHRIRGATVPPPRSAVDVGGLRLEVTEVQPRLEVAVRPRARGP